MSHPRAGCLHPDSADVTESHRWEDDKPQKFIHPTVVKTGRPKIEEPPGSEASKESQDMAEGQESMQREGI